MGNGRDGDDRRLFLNPQSGRLEPPQRTENTIAIIKPTPPYDKKGRKKKKPVQLKTVIQKLRPKQQIKLIQHSPVVIPKWLAKTIKNNSRPPVLTGGEIEGRHKGELVFVLGNGPSLLAAEQYREQLASYTAIGTNSSYLCVSTDYHVFLDAHLWNYCAGDLLSLNSAVFYPGTKPLHHQLPCFTQFGNYTSGALTDKWSAGLHRRGVSITAFNLAYLFGAKEIALLGVDLNGTDHFYTGHEKRFDCRFVREFAALWKKAYSPAFYPHSHHRFSHWNEIAKQLEGHVKVWNCSPNSALDCFEKIELSELLKKRHKRKKVYPKTAEKIQAWRDKITEITTKVHFPKTKFSPVATKKLNRHEINDRHKGRQIFIYGNGPSLLLAEKYANKLANEISIGVNSSYLLLPSTYLLFSDHHLWKYCASELLTLDSVIFSEKKQGLTWFNQFKKYQPTEMLKIDGEILSPDWGMGLYKGISSTIASINLAYLFGAKEIALLGVDLNSPDHFYTNDERFKNDRIVKFRHKWWGQYDSLPHYPKIDERLADWRAVAKHLKKRNVKFWNCSPDSLLDCAEKIEIGKLLKRK